jgi:hypothetical protein
MQVNHLPSGRFCANAAWMTLNVMAHNLGRWVGRIGLGREATCMTTKTLRTRMLNMPGRMTCAVPEPFAWAGWARASCGSAILVDQTAEYLSSADRGGQVDHLTRIVDGRPL